MSGISIQCEICVNNQHKYKCPKCLLKYCSVPCFKLHKENGCSKLVQNPVQRSPPETPMEADDNDQENSSDTVPAPSLEKLGSSERLHALLRNPSLRQLLQQLDSSDAPSDDLARAMQNNNFAEFADTCLELVDKDNVMKENISFHISDSDSD